MNDPFGSMQGFLGQFQSFMQDPTKMLQQRLGFPQASLNNPTQLIQHLMDSGRMSQQQYNYLNRIAGQIQNNPAFRQLFKK